MTPTVPTTVTASGVTPDFSSQRASGENRAVKNPRACLLSIRLPRPGFSHLLTDLVKRLRNGLGLGDDREEVAVSAPTGNYVLVERAGYARPARDALVHAQIEAAGIRYFPQHTHGCLREFSEFGRFL